MSIFSSFFFKSNSNQIEIFFILKALGRQPSLDNTIKKRIDIWVTGVNVLSKYITYFDLSKHLRGLKDSNEYWSLGSLINSSISYERNFISNDKKSSIINLTDYGDDKVVDLDMFEIISKNSVIKNSSKKEVLSKEEIIQIGKKAYDIISDELNKGLSKLPNLKITCYRYLELMDGNVYNRKIKEGDLIMDKSFIASSIFRGAGGNSKWYSEFTSATLGAFFIIEGYSGKYIAKYSHAFNEEEVVFKNNTIFEVTKIITEGKNSFFVFIKEIEITPEGQIIKNPFNGDIY